jgi:hypothetical protein
VTWSGLFALSNGSTRVLARQERSDDCSIEGARGEMRMMAWLMKTLHAFDLDRGAVGSGELPGRVHSQHRRGGFSAGQAASHRFL